MTVSAGPAAAESQVPFARHVLERTVVLPGAARALPPGAEGRLHERAVDARRAGGHPGRPLRPLAAPRGLAALTVHDMNLWPDEHRLSRYDESERARLLAEDGWLRFSLVRDPAPRLWSGWQSKLLLREPRFVEDFGDAPWFPRVPWLAGDIVDDFRAFVTALAARRGGGRPLGRPARPGRAAPAHARRARRAHRGDARAARGPRRRRRRPRRRPPREPQPAADAAGALRRGDRGGAGRSPRAPTTPPTATSRLQEAGAGAGRLGGRGRAAAPAPARDDRRARPPRPAPPRRPAAHGPRPAGGGAPRDRLDAPGGRHALAGAHQPRGPHRLQRALGVGRGAAAPWLHRGRADPRRGAQPAVGAAAAAGRGRARRAARQRHRATAARRWRAGSLATIGGEDRLEVRDYPFAVARCGEDHLGTPPDSVHSLTYFYNWSFAQVRSAYALKWDGDMVLTDAATVALRDLAWQLEAAEVVVKVPRYPLYLADDRRAFVDTRLRNCEPWGWPNGPGYSFAKAIDWELPIWAPDTPTLTLPDWGCVELKRLDADEFGHWSQHRLRRLGAHQPQAPRVGGLPRARRRRRAAGGRRRGRGARRRARDRPRAHELAAAPCRRPLARAAGDALAVAQPREPRGQLPLQRRDGRRCRRGCAARRGPAAGRRARPRRCGTRRRGGSPCAAR